MNKADIFGGIQEIESRISEKRAVLEFDTSIYPQLTLGDIQSRCLELTRPLREKKVSFILEIANISSYGGQVIETWKYGHIELLPSILVYDATFDSEVLYNSTCIAHAELVRGEGGARVTLIKPEQ